MKKNMKELKTLEVIKEEIDKFDNFGNQLFNWFEELEGNYVFKTGNLIIFEYLDDKVISILGKLIKNRIIEPKSSSLLHFYSTSKYIPEYKIGKLKYEQEKGYKEERYLPLVFQKGRNYYNIEKLISDLSEK